MLQQRYAITCTSFKDLKYKCASWATKMLSVVCFAFLFGLVVDGGPLPPLPDDHCDRCPTKLAPNDANVLRAAYFVVGQLGPAQWLVKVQRAEAEVLYISLSLSLSLSR